jgi:2-polyprenyl-3-methyl-5-hydroxy-6-metoxy-1,4-benzoquinol methylase
MENHKESKSKLKDVKFQTSEMNDYSGEFELLMNEYSLHNYNKAIIDLFLHTSIKRGNRLEKVMDFGAGIGTLAKLFLSASGIKPDCVEIDPNFRRMLSESEFELRDLKCIDEKSYDLIYTSNVLEHIEDDRKVIRDLSKVINPNGLIAIYVPAFPILYSKLDARVGHYRRYSKSTLKTLFQDLPMEITECRYVDSIGFFASLASKMCQKIGFDATNSVKSLIIYDRVIFPISQFFDQIGFKMLVGKNIYLVARRTHDGVVD